MCVLRQNEAGQLEAITDSIQILSVESDEQLPAEVPSESTDNTLITTTTTNSPEPPTTLLIKQEYNASTEDEAIIEENENTSDGLQINVEETDGDGVAEMKPHICELQQKQEVVEEEEEEERNLFDEELVEVETESVFLNENDGDEHYGNLFVEEEEEEKQEDTDTEDYNVVEGLHVTADTEIETTVYEQPPIKIKQGKIQNTRLFKNNKNEKENVSMYNWQQQKPNPRSVLKSSFPLLEENKKDVVDKRILKNSKVSSQARFLQNFIAKTTIIHAPVRQERLPRKQTIKPVQTRQDEEIIVQEVVVSSNGFIETSEDGVLKSKEPLQATVFLNVSDSDDDYDPKKPNRKRRRSKKDKPKVITIIDSEDEEKGIVIEVSDDDVEVVKKSEIKCTKCTKTFPSQGSLKTHMQYHNFKETTENNKFICKHCKAPFKNSLLLNKHLADHKNLGCTICKKIFLTAIELSTHRRMHIKKQMCHTTIAQKHSPKTTKKPKTPPKLYRCDFCHRTFKDPTLLEAHTKTHKKFTCTNCSAGFMSKIVLDLHVRENCVKIKKTPTKVAIFENVKCEKCGKCFTSHQMLFRHKVAEHGLETPDKTVLLKKNVKKPLVKAKPVHGGIPMNHVLRNTYSSIRRKIAES